MNPQNLIVQAKRNILQDTLIQTVPINNIQTPQIIRDLREHITPIVQPPKPTNIIQEFIFGVRGARAAQKDTLHLIWVIVRELGIIAHHVKVRGVTTRPVEQADELFATFSPPLPEKIEDEGERYRRIEILMPELTMEEVERGAFSANLWKAPGSDSLLAVVWQQLWPVVKDRVLRSFKTLLMEGDLPVQWRDAKIIPLKKPDRGDYTIAKEWRPISLLPTLGSVLEAVVAERISYAAEEYGLLQTNHFGAGKLALHPFVGRCPLRLPICAFCRFRAAVG